MSPQSQWWQCRARAPWRRASARRTLQVAAHLVGKFMNLLLGSRQHGLGARGALGGPPLCPARLPACTRKPGCLPEESHNPIPCKPAEWWLVWMLTTRICPFYPSRLVPGSRTFHVAGMSRFSVQVSAQTNPALLQPRPAGFAGQRLERVQRGVQERAHVRLLEVGPHLRVAASQLARIEAYACGGLCVMLVDMSPAHRR